MKPDQPTAAHRAVARCTRAYNATYAREMDTGKSHPVLARQEAAVAYRAAMPALEGRAVLPAYVAAVAHGIVLQVFTGKEASQLLYAAQVAVSVQATDAKPTTTHGYRGRNQDANELAD